MDGHTNSFSYNFFMPSNEKDDYERVLFQPICPGIIEYLFIGLIFVLQVLNQDETPLLYSLVFGEGVVNDATSVVLFRAVQTYNFGNFTPLEGFQIAGSFLYLFFASCFLGIAVSISFPLDRSDSVDVILML